MASLASTATAIAPAPRSRRSRASASTAPVTGLKQAHADVIGWLYQSHGPTTDQIFKYLEDYFATKREHLIYVVAGFWALYMMLGNGAQFLSNLIGFVYPCYASVIAIRTPGQDDDTQWLVYWTTFGSFFLVDAMAGVFLSWFPFYFILKTAFLVYLWLPQTMGAEYMYKKYVDPGFNYIEENILKKYC